jgi:integrase
MNTEFTSALSSHIDAYIKLKHTMGVAFRDGERYLHSLDDYCARTGMRQLTKEVVEGWICEWERDVKPKHRNWISYIKGFGLYLQANIDSAAYVIPDGFGKRPTRATPYLFANEEIEAFFEAAAVFKNRSVWHWQAKAFFGLMAACGLRTCEARKLEVSDVDLSSGKIDIRWSKGPRSRRLFINDDVARMLDICDKKNRLHFTSRKTFFVTGRGNPANPVVVGETFRRIWNSAGLPWSKESRHPRPYDLRHRFAYANIERWAAEGKDVMAMMPYLMRYMGHASLESTYYYLHVSPDFMSKYTTQVATTDCVLPEVDFDD